MRSDQLRRGLAASGFLLMFMPLAAAAQQPAEPSTRRLPANEAEAGHPPRGEYVTRQDVASGRVDLDSEWRQFHPGIPYRYDPEVDESWGFRNPGGVGRMSEYYPPGNRFQNGGSPVEAARFDRGPAATRRGMQLRSKQVGIARSNALQQHIDRYGMPRIGFGWGFGIYPY